MLYVYVWDVLFVYVFVAANMAFNKVDPKRSVTRELKKGEDSDQCLGQCFNNEIFVDFC